MYTATIPITITNFVPYAPNQACVGATLGTPINTSAKGSGGSQVFRGTGSSVIVSVPSSYTGAVQLTFQLPTNQYVLLGIFVVSKKAPSGAGGQAVASTGRQQFRTIVINRDRSGSQMVVTDACSPGDNGYTFDYNILVQATSEAPANQGQIGVIDPDIETETSD